MSVSGFVTTHAPLVPEELPPPSPCVKTTVPLLLLVPPPLDDWAPLLLVEAAPPELLLLLDVPKPLVCVPLEHEAASMPTDTNTSAPNRTMGGR
jgi:hypothetical protein